MAPIVPRMRSVVHQVPISKYRGALRDMAVSQKPSFGHYRGRAALCASCRQPPCLEPLLMCSVTFGARLCRGRASYLNSAFLMARAGLRSWCLCLTEPLLAVVRVNYRCGGLRCGLGHALEKNVVRTSTHTAVRQQDMPAQWQKRSRK